LQPKPKSSKPSKAFSTSIGVLCHVEKPQKASKARALCALTYESKSQKLKASKSSWMTIENRQPRALRSQGVIFNLLTENLEPNLKLKS
jgi:hypothetical protein